MGLCSSPLEHCFGVFIVDEGGIDLIIAVEPFLNLGMIDTVGMTRTES